MGVITQGSGGILGLDAGPGGVGRRRADRGGAVCRAQHPPLRFLEHCGFDIVQSKYLFHRWLDEELP